MRQERRATQTGTSYKKQNLFLVVLSLLLLALVFSSCSANDVSSPQTGQHKSFTSSTGAQQVTYSTDAQTVLIRTFYGGGLYGSLELSPQISIYGDGTYVLGSNQQGQLSADDLQHLLSTLVDNDGLLNLKRLQFSDLPDQNATFLQMALNGKQYEMMHGSFGNQQESAQDTAEYQQLGKALTTITEALKGPNHPYSANNSALLVRQMFSPDLNNIHYWSSTLGFTLQQAALFECGKLPTNNDHDPNNEVGCLKYTIPNNAILAGDNEIQAIKNRLNGQQQGDFVEGDAYYTVTLRPLLPDELAKKALAMFGSAQSAYKAVPLHESGKLPTTDQPG